MVGKISFIVTLIFSIACSNVQARTVTKVKINSSGQTLDPPQRNTKEECKSFKPTTKQVKNYFRNAYPVEAYIVTTERYSPCYATGTLEFSDGHFGTWTLHSSGTAIFKFNRGDVVNYYFKNNKWRDPYACTYGLGDVGKC